MFVGLLGRRLSDGGLSLCQFGARAGGPAAAFGCAIGPAVRRRRHFPCRFSGGFGLFEQFCFYFSGTKGEFSECSTPASFLLAFSVRMVAPHLSALLEAAMLVAVPDKTLHRLLKLALRAYAPPPLFAPALVPLKRNPSRLCRAFLAVTDATTNVNVADEGAPAAAKRAAALAALSEAFRVSVGTYSGPGKTISDDDATLLCDTVYASWAAELHLADPRTLRDALLSLSRGDDDFVESLEFAMYALRRAFAERCLAWRSACFSQGAARRRLPCVHSRCSRRTCGGHYGPTPGRCPRGAETAPSGRRPPQVHGSVCIAAGRSTPRVAGCTGTEPGTRCVRSRSEPFIA